MSVQPIEDRAKAIASRPPDWRRGLPTLEAPTVTLRALRKGDAPSLLRTITRPSVVRHIAAPPSTEDAFRRFIRWTNAARRRGQHVCFGIVPTGRVSAVGVVQMWPLMPDFSVAEWGFVLDEAYWGSGVFYASACLMLEYAFTSIGVRRVEARAAAGNARGNGVLRKLGAVREGYLRQCSPCGDHHEDHLMWSILRDEWHPPACRVAP